MGLGLKVHRILDRFSTDFDFKIASNFWKRSNILERFIKYRLIGLFFKYEKT